MELGRQAGFVKDIPGVFYESGIIEYLGILQNITSIQR